MLLKNKVAIVTGGNSGIGKAIVLALAKQGANIAIDYVSHPEATEELERQVASLGDRALGVDADVSKVADLERLIAATVKAFGRLDIMVNNAGIETRTSILDTTEQQYEKGPLPSFDDIFPPELRSSSLRDLQLSHNAGDTNF